VALVPTGGVTRSNVADYIAAGAAAVGAGADLTAGPPEQVSAAARAYVDAVRAARKS
jgi:2-dehydro-3-deoxyphosphogluconate aldolase / (4S)-4-hydroxy-2-oxoglutarate aldolase